MPSFTRNKRKKKLDTMTEISPVGSGRYRKVDQAHSNKSVIRSVTTQRKSEQAKNIRSQSVPSLNSSSTANPAAKQPSPSHQPRFNSVRASSNTKKISFRRKLAKIFGSHSDLNNSTDSNQPSTGVYRQLGTVRTHSVGGSSDCSSSSLTSAPQQYEFSRHSSLRDSSRSRVSQNSVFSSRQPSCDSTDTFNYAVHGPMVPSESTLRPRSIACMQRSGSSSSLRNNALHITDPRYYSLAALSSNRIETSESFIHSIDERVFNNAKMSMAYRHRGILPQEGLEFEESSKRVRPSDPGYKKIAETLMTCSPQPPNEDMLHTQRSLDIPSDYPVRKNSTELMEEYILSGDHMRAIHPPSPVTPYQSRLQEIKRSRTPDITSVNSVLPSGWESTTTATGLRYYINHSTQTTHWNLPSNSDDPDDSDLPSGWELVKSRRYGTYFVNHNNCTAQYQHPVHTFPPPPYSVAIHDTEADEMKDRKTPLRSHSHRSSQAHRIFDPNASLPRRSKSFRNEPSQIDSAYDSEEVLHTRQLSTMTYVPPSPYQIAEIPPWLRNYVDAPFGSEKDKQIQWTRFSPEDLNGLDTMIKRLLKKNSEQLVKKFEYYRVALQQEIEQRHKQAKKKPHTHHHHPPTLLAHPPSKPNQGYVPPNNIFPHRLHPQYQPTRPFPPTSNYCSSSDYHQPVTSTVKSDDQYNGSEETFL